MPKAKSIFGPPGTGKSTYIIGDMTAKLDSGYDAHRIGLVSFTKAAAQELAKRVGIAPGGNISTIHSMAFRLAELSRDQVISNADLREFGDKIKVPITGSNPEEGEFAEVGDAYLALHAKLRAMKLYHEEGLEEGFVKSRIEGSLWQFKYFCRNYDQYKASMGLVDFTDMLSLAMSCHDPDVDVLYVDEAQDLSPIQWDLVYKWANSVDEIVIAGDDDQSIYVWGGADPEGMARFTEDFKAEKVVLDQSYRIPVQVHTMANRVIHRINGPRVDKVYKPTDHGGSLQVHAGIWTLDKHIDTENMSDILVLYRNHSLREDFEEFLMTRGYPYIVESGKPGALQSMYARAAIVWGKLQRGWEEHKAVVVPKRMLTPLLKLAKPTIRRRIQNEDLTGIAGNHWSKIINVPGPKAMYLRRLENKYGSLESITPTIRLSTIHGSKGQEADHVILINGMTERTYESMSIDPDSEIRTFYVGITRTRKRLDIVTSQNPVTFLEA